MGGGCFADLRVQVSCLAQRAAAAAPALWTFSTWHQELGALQLSAKLEHILQPHRCRISRSSLVALVRVAMLIVASLRVVLCGLGNRMDEWAGVALLIACASLMPRAAGGVFSSAVDIFNVTSGAWSTAALSVARGYLAATSLPNLAIFAGGQICTCCHVYFRIFACCVVRVGESDG